jgi:hypothetical protein
VAELYVIACSVVIEELRPLLPASTPVLELEFGLHRDPDRLRQRLQDEIDNAPDGATILLGYGLCGNGAAGLLARRNRVVIPRVHDCIALFLGSREAYQQQVAQEVGTYYLTKGWLDQKDDLLYQFERCVSKYGPERGPEIARMSLEHYTRLALIRTGGYDLEHYRGLARRVAELYQLRHEEIEGSPVLLKAFSAGEWDERFLVFEPGETIQMEAFL